MLDLQPLSVPRWSNCLRLIIRWEGANAVVSDQGYAIYVRMGGLGRIAVLQYPERNEVRTALRRVIEMVAQGHPVTAALVHLYGYTHPSKFEEDLTQFLRDVAASANDHEERLSLIESFLSPRSTVGDLALDVCFYMLCSNTTGLSKAVPLDELRIAFPESDRLVLEEAVAELVSVGYATVPPTIGHPVHLVHSHASMFLAFDLPATGRDTRVDALKVASLLLSDATMGNVFRLQEHLGWEPRRLNPALAALRHVFSGNHWSRERHRTLVTGAVVVTPAERFKLRRIVESGRVD